MSYQQPPRFFSLNNKQQGRQSETSSAPTAAPQFTSTENSLDILIRAADNNNNQTSATKIRGGGIHQDNNNNNNMASDQQPQLPSTDNNNNIPNSNNNNMTSATDNNNSTLNNNDNQNQGRDMGLQQTFLQAMGNNNNNLGNGGFNNNPPQQNNNSAASQFNQLMAAQQQQGGTTPQPTTNNQLNNNLFQQPQGGGLGGMQQQQPQVNNGMLTQLVASLQAQQQAQVQAALSRAFGPGANQHNMLPQVGGGAQSLLQGLQGLANHNISIPGMNHHQQQGGNDNGGGHPTQGSMQWLNQNPQAMQQVANAVQQQQNQNQVSQQGGGQHDTPNLDQAAVATNQAMASKQPPSNNTTSSNKESNGRIAPHATGDELIKLQLEQERHNRMLQMVQHDRQERAMLANQEAIMKKMKKTGNIVGSVVPNPNKGASSEPLTNDAVSSLYNQVAVNNNTLALQNNMLNANALAGSMGLPQMNFPNNNGGGIPQAAHLQNNLLAAAASAGGMTDLAAKINSVSTATQHQLNNAILPSSSRGAAIVPCRARGMPVDHNFKTAYFVIPDGIEHGDELMCSYPACRQAGVKFRYCLQCRVPVAKRNFRNRHRHGVPGEEDEWENEDSGEEEETTQDICRPVNDGDNGKMSSDAKDEEDYAGVKKEHILIIPGADPANTMPKKKKPRKSKRVPCRARGMPMAHNYKTAYFVIPTNVEHGDELLCSFPACLSAGAKFRYCLHCKVPVAKRNFRNRHRHGAAQPGGTKKGNLKTPETSDDKKTGNNNEEDGNKVTIESSHDANKVQKWVELLENKPEATDKSAMAVWMLNLMNATQGGGDNKPEAAEEDTTTRDNKPKALEQAVPAPKEQTAGDAPPPEIPEAASLKSDTAVSSVGEEEGSASSSSDQPLKKRKTQGKDFAAEV